MTPLVPDHPGTYGMVGTTGTPTSLSSTTAGGNLSSCRASSALESDRSAGGMSPVASKGQKLSELRRGPASGAARLLRRVWLSLMLVIKVMRVDRPTQQLVS
jgi:hypothetical protein